MLKRMISLHLYHRNPATNALLSMAIARHVDLPKKPWSLPLDPIARGALDPKCANLLSLPVGPSDLDAPAGAVSKGPRLQARDFRQLKTLFG